MLTTSLAKCGSSGPMVCLNGAFCNETLAVCQGCPSGFRDDEALFQGNINCGLEERAMYAIYIIASILATYVGIRAASLARQKKKSNMRMLLVIDAVWNLCIPFLALAHYLEGFKHGIASIVLSTAILMMVNTQVIFLMYIVEKFMGILCNFSSPEKIYRSLKYWYLFWMTNKLVCGCVMLYGVSTGDLHMYNIAQLVNGCSVYVEVSCNILRTVLNNERLVRSVRALHGELKSADNNPVVAEFADKVRKGRFIAPIYGSIVFGIGLSCPILFVIYDGSIPFAYILWALLLLTWPTVGLRPILLLRSKLGQHMIKGSKGTDKNTTAVADAHDDRSKQSRQYAANSSTFVPSPNNSSNNAMRKNMAKRGGDEEELSSSNPQHEGTNKMTSYVE